MSAPPPHHRGARPRDTPHAPRVRYACVACEFEDFQSAHSIRRHMVRIHNLALLSKGVLSLTSDM